MDAFLQKRRPRRVLVVSSSPTAPPRYTTGVDNRVFRVNLGAARALPGSLRCAPDRLPFQSRVFDLVLAHHVLCDGAEPEFREFERVLEGGGYLLILGLGYWCGRFRFARGETPATAIRPLRLCRALRNRDFVIESCAGQDVAGLHIGTGDGWKAPLVGISDQVMILARTAGNQHVVTPLKFGRAQTVGARSTAMDAFNREAAL